MRQGNHAAGNGSTRAAAGAPDRYPDIPRISACPVGQRLGREIARELRCVCHAQNDKPAVAPTANHRAVTSWLRRREEARGEAGGQHGRIQVHILKQEWDTPKWRQLFGSFAVHLVRLGPRRIKPLSHNRIQRWVLLFDRRNRGLSRLTHGEVSRGDPTGQVQCIGLEECAHRGFCH